MPFLACTMEKKICDGHQYRACPDSIRDMMRFMVEQLDGNIRFFV